MVRWLKCRWRLRQLRSPEHAVKKRAVQALGAIGHLAAVEPLIQVLNQDYPLSDIVADALGRLGDVRALGPLMTYFETQCTQIVAHRFDFAMCAILKRSATTASESDLRRLVALPAKEYTSYEGYAYSDMEPGSRTQWETEAVTRTFGCGNAMTLARDELRRRGLIS